MDNKPYIIGITGASASGKTFFLEALRKHLGEENICLISQDNYYRPKEEQPLDENGIANYDTPFSLDLDRFLHDIKAIKAGRTIELLEYTFNNPNIIPATITYKPAPVIITEGIFLFYHPEILEQFDLKIFLDAKEHVKLKRRITRDKKERGYELEDVLYRYEYHVSPTYEKYILPFKDEADIIIPNNKNICKGLEIINLYLTNKINGK
jgi:uridine kinase